MIQGNTAICREMVKKCRFHESVAAMQQERSKGPDDKMFCEEGDGL